MKRIRVAQLTPTYFDDDCYIGGGERYVSNVVQSLQNHFSDKIETEIISFTKKVAFDAEVVTLQRDKVSIKLLPNLLQSENLMEATSRFLWRELPAFDIIHVHQPFSLFGVIATTIARHLGIPIVASDLGGGGSPELLRRNSIKLADAIVCISEFSAQLIRPITTTPIHVVIGPIDTNVFSPQETSRTPKLQVSCVGRILPHKGIDRVVRALPSGLPLVICGRVYDSRYYELLQNLAEGKNVRFMTEASDSDIIHLYRTSTVNVLASTYQDCFGNVHIYPELMGLTVIEAMACGTPVFVSRVASLPELVIPNETGRIFEDEDQLATFLEDVRIGNWPPKNITANCVAHVERSFSTQAVSRAILNVYHAALTTRRQIFT
jgi:glycosyltransferase involved in cell wall biosynthesis